MRIVRFIPLFLLASGCQLNVKPGAESLLEFKTGPTPGEFAAMAIDPYDANNRFVGTMGLAAESFASEPLYLKLFKDNLKDPDPSVRAAAARGLGMHGEPADAPDLARALTDKDPMLRLEAARALQRIHNDEVVDALVAAMREPRTQVGLSRAATPGEPDAAVRAEAAIALGQYAEPRVMQALIAGLDDSELSVNDAALRSLRVLTGQDFGLDSAAWADWSSRTSAPFAGRGQYQYPAFSRPLKWWEYIPMVPRPPNELAGPPAGMPRG